MLHSSIGPHQWVFIATPQGIGLRMIDLACDSLFKISS